jgi:hypothetical protein
MAIQISGTTVVNDSRQLQNIASLDSTTAATIGAAAGGGVTHLGTLVPQSGAISATLSNLTLTSYKMLEINIEGVSYQNFSWLSLTNSADRNGIAYTLSMSGKTLSVRVVVDLATSAVYAGIAGITTTSNGVAARQDNYAGAKTNYDINITNSSTSVGIYTRGAGYGFTATGGSIRFYGVA